MFRCFDLIGPVKRCGQAANPVSFLCIFGGTRLAFLLAEIPFANKCRHRHIFLFPRMLLNIVPTEDVENGVAENRPSLRGHLAIEFPNRLIEKKYPEGSRAETGFYLGRRCEVEEWLPLILPNSK